MKNYISLFLLIFFLGLFSSCEKDEGSDANEVPNNNTANPINIPLEVKYNITEPYFFTGDFNGERITFQAGLSDNSTSYPAFNGYGSDNYTKNSITGFFALLTLEIHYFFDYFNLSPSINLFDTLHNYYLRKGYSRPNDTMTYWLTYRKNIDNEWRTFKPIQSPSDKFVMEKVIAEVPMTDSTFRIPKRYRCFIDSLILKVGTNEILVTDLHIQCKYEN